jgi:hypothetical protein
MPDNVEFYLDSLYVAFFDICMHVSVTSTFVLFVIVSVSQMIHRYRSVPLFICSTPLHFVHLPGLVHFRFCEKELSTQSIGRADPGDQRTIVNDCHNRSGIENVTRPCYINDPPIFPEREPSSSMAALPLNLDS